MNFIRIGERYINLDQVIKVEQLWMDVPEVKKLSITTTGTDEGIPYSIEVNGKAAERLLEFLEDIATRITPKPSDI